MTILDKLTTLKLKRIADVEQLVLCSYLDYKNLKELWLVEENTDNKQLELLTKIKGLETLRIRRSQLKPDSLAIFAKMPSLKASHP
jgi:ribonuclease HI